jgi:hypothetical protein
MRSYFQPAHPIAASLAAFVLLTANAVVTAAVVSAGGIVVMLFLDYGRGAAPLRARADVVPFEAGAQNPAGTQEAA